MFGKKKQDQHPVTGEEAGLEALKRIQAYFDEHCTGNEYCPIPHDSVGEARNAIITAKKRREASA